MHFPGGHPRLTLSVILPCEARTFLAILPFGVIPRDCTTWFDDFIIIPEKCGFVKCIAEISVVWAKWGFCGARFWCICAERYS